MSLVSIQSVLEFQSIVIPFDPSVCLGVHPSIFHVSAICPLSLG